MTSAHPAHVNGSYFRAVRDKKINGITLLSNEPIATISNLGMNGHGQDGPDISQSFMLDIARARTSFIVACIEEKQKPDDVKDADSKIKKSCKIRGKKSKDEVLSEVKPQRLTIPSATAAALQPSKVAQRASIGWLTLKEGFLYKTKKVSKGFHKSTKLRYFMLKQDPITRSSQLEYYEGLVRKGVVPLRNTEIRLTKPGAFIVISDGRDTELATEKTKIKDAMGWVLALQQASASNLPPGFQPAATKVPTVGSVQKKLQEAEMKAAEEKAQGPFVGISTGDDDQAALAALESPMPDLSPASPVTHRRRGGDSESEEVDGYAIDNARWAALRKGWERAMKCKTVMSEDSEDVEVYEDDEDVRLMREMEEEEERRQEEERQQWLAERAVKQQQESLAAHEGGDSAVQDDEEAAYSEDEEDWLADMQAAEEEEERRMEEERRQFLAEKAAAKEKTNN